MAGEIAKAYVQVIPSTSGIKSKLTSAFGSEMPAAGKSAGSLFSGGLVGTIKTALAAAGIGSFIKDSLSAGADLQQSLGGIETMFKDSAAEVVSNAREAYRNTGQSANAYMEQVTGFSASLIKSLSGDTAKAAEISDMAMTDMSDNANKMGTDMERITDAYQGFAKQNYTMLDNLKLGYGGTKTEMERLLADAQKLTGVKYDINNLADVYSVIHAIQEEMGITGTTAKEAASTLKGSLNAMKAVATDVLGNLALGEDIKPSLNALADTTVTFLAGNLVPAVWNIITALPGAAVTFVKALLPGDMTSVASTAVSEFSASIKTGLPTVLSSGKEMILQLVTGFLSGTPSFLKSSGDLMNQMVATVLEAGPVVLESGASLILELASGCLSSLPSIISSATSITLDMLATFASHLPEFLAQGISIITQLITGAISMVPGVITTAIEIATNFLNTVQQTDWLSLGIDIISTLISGVISMGSEVIATATEVAANVLDTIGNVDWLSLGKDIVGGIVSGLWDAASSLYKAIKDIILNALSAGQNAAEVHSPSRLFRRELGYQLPAGAALGVLDGIPLVEQAISRMHEATLDPFTANQRIGTVNYTVSGSGNTGNHSTAINVTQHIYSEAKSAADLMREARYQQELAVMMHV